MSRKLYDTKPDIIQVDEVKGVEYNLTTEVVLNPNVNEGKIELIPDRVDEVLGFENSTFAFMSESEKVRKMRKNQKGIRQEAVDTFLKYELRGFKNQDATINQDLEDYNIRSKIEQNIEISLADQVIQENENRETYQGFGGFMDEKNLSEYTGIETKLYHGDTIAETARAKWHFTAGVDGHGGFRMIDRHDKAVAASLGLDVQLKTSNDKILDLDYAYLDGFNRMNKGGQEALKPEKSKEVDTDYIIEDDMFKGKRRRTLKLTPDMLQ